MTIAFANYKSSVGKTTCAINLAASLQKRGHTVRLWDLDGQRDLTTLGEAAGLQVEPLRAISLASSIAAHHADFHLIECPPRKEMESEVLLALQSCDRLVVPNECEYMMLRGMGNFGSTLNEARRRNPRLQWRALITKYKPRQKKHLATFLASGMPQFETIIRDSVWVADAPAYDKAVIDYKPRSAPAKAFMAWAQEVEAWK